MEKCNCGHFKHDHLLAYESLDTLNHLPRVPTHFGEGVIRTPQESRGLCKQCTCPKYKSQGRFRPKHIEYPKRETDIDNTEQRCVMCGRLLSNHADVDHSFQDNSEGY